MARFLKYHRVSDGDGLAMPTSAETATGGTPLLARDATTQKVVIVNGSMEILGLLETVLDAGHYDVVFVESSDHAYSQIKRVRPHLVILCVRIDDADGLQVLSMLKLDDDTKAIPVLTYTTQYETEETVEESPEPSDNEMFAPKPAAWMN